ncbi:MAG: hypothetical protein IJ614_01585 [Prevotella sp.]|nr:hypothetical protein [Prevotella sp.]
MMKQLYTRTAQYAIEYIKGEGMHTGITKLRDSFNELCEAIGANEFNPDGLSFEIEDLAENLKKEPWVAEIAGKGSMITLPMEDIDLIVNNFICEHWLMRPEEVTTKHVADILKVADPFSHRHLVGQKVAIDCIHALDKEQLQRLDSVLRDLEMNPKISYIQSIS